jgi:hypothetical protein
MLENMSNKVASVREMSCKPGNGQYEVIDANELATRWRVPVSWVQNRTSG